MFRLLLVISALLGLVSGARAQFANVAPSISSGVSGGSVGYSGGMPAAFARQIGTAPGSAARIIDNIRLGLPAGAVAEVAVGRVLTRAALTAGVGIAVGTGVGAVGVAVAPIVWDWMQSKGYLPGGLVDPGQEKSSRGGLMQDFRTGQPMAPGAIASREASNYCQSQSGNGYTCTVLTSTGGCTSGTCQFSWTAQVRYPNSQPAWRGGGNDTGPEITAVICPATSLAPVVVAYGGKPCASDSRAPATEAQRQAAIEAIPAELAPRIAEELLDKVPFKTEEPVLSGPSSVTAPPKVTTGTGGQVSTETKTHNLTYNGNTYNFTTSTVNVAGDTTTTIENDLPKDDPKTDCEKNPEAIGCLGVGKVPDVDFKPTNVTVDVSPTGGWGSDSGSCPAPKVVSVMGMNIAVDNSLLCKFLSGIRFAVIGAFGMIAVMVFVGGLNR